MRQAGDVDQPSTNKAFGRAGAKGCALGSFAVAALGAFTIVVSFLIVLAGGSLRSGWVGGLVLLTAWIIGWFTLGRFLWRRADPS